MAGAGGAALGVLLIVPELTVVLQFGQPLDTTVPLQLEHPLAVTTVPHPQDGATATAHPQLGAGAGVEHPQLGAGAGAWQHFGAGAGQHLLRRPRAKLTSATLDTTSRAATAAIKNRFIGFSPSE